MTLNVRPIVWLGARKKMENDKQTEIEVGSGNVFADLDLDNADELYIRACLGVQIMKIIRERGYSQKEAAELLGLKQSEVSALMRAKFSRFSQERLIRLLNKLSRKVVIQISDHHEGEPYQQVTFAS
jgi:predicted XRE-type DNA-binding protein